MSAQVDGDDGYQIANAVLVGVQLIVAFGLCCLGFCFLRRRGDKERQGVALVKAAWVFFALYGSFTVLSRILLVTGNLADQLPQRTTLGLWRASDHTLNSAGFLGGLTNIFVFIALARLGSGILRAPEPEGARNWARVFGWVCYAFALIMGIFVLAEWAVNLDLLRRAWDFDYESPLSDSRMRLHVFRLHVAVLVLFLVLSVLMVVWSSIVLGLTVKKPKDSRRMTKPAVLLLVSSILWLFNRCYKLGEFATLFDITRFIRIYWHPYFLILDALFNFLVLFVLLSVLFGLCRVRDYRGGLYSNSTQPPIPVPGQAPPRQQWAQGPQGMHAADPKFRHAGQPQVTPVFYPNQPMDFQDQPMQQHYQYQYPQGQQPQQPQRPAVQPEQQGPNTVAAAPQPYQPDQPA